MANGARYAQEGTIAFEKVGLFLVALLLFFKRYDKLAKAFVRLNGYTRTDAEIITFLKSHLALIPESVPEGQVVNA